MESYPSSTHQKFHWHRTSDPHACSTDAKHHAIALTNSCPTKRPRNVSPKCWSVPCSEASLYIAYYVVRCATYKILHYYIFYLPSQSVSQSGLDAVRRALSGRRRYTLHTLHAHWQQKSKNVLKCCFQSSQFCAATSQWANPWCYLPKTHNTYIHVIYCILNILRTTYYMLQTPYHNHTLHTTHYIPHTTS